MPAAGSRAASAAACSPAPAFRSLPSKAATPRLLYSRAANPYG